MNDLLGSRNDRIYSEEEVPSKDVLGEISLVNANILL